MLRYYITDRRSIGGADVLFKNIARLGNSVDYVQIREKDLTARELRTLVREVLRVAHPSVRVLVNDRADVAVACGAHGVHLRTDAVTVATMRCAVPEHFVISVACHTLDAVREASDGGATLALLAPIFATPGKGPPLGLETLRAAVAANTIPVLALGGVDQVSAPACMVVGAAGIAGIRLFQ